MNREDRTYFKQRAEFQRDCASAANDAAVRVVHLRLAEAYEWLAFPPARRDEKP